MCQSGTSDTQAEAFEPGETYEEQHVHRVYEAIAPHFSLTRYKPWPVIERFLLSLEPGSVGLDAGCGNGKYLPVNPAVVMLASDRSASLLDIAAQHTKETPHDTLVADALALPHPTRRFDFAISVAVIHHLSTRARRVGALAALISLLRPRRGRLLVFVWALEQQGSRRGWTASDSQDIMVPWVLQRSARKAWSPGKGPIDHASSQNTSIDEQEKGIEGPRTFHRYYHLYREGELEEDLCAAGGTVVEMGYERDNWWAIVGGVMEETR